MHNASMILMKNLVASTRLMGGTVVDVGSQDINGTYRGLFGPSWKYIGVDQVKGKNVDIVMTSEYSIPLSEESSDVVISGQTIEHCRNPFKLVSEMARILKPQGTMILIAPFKWSVHRYPIDCWRFLPDGMKCLFDNAGISLVKSEIMSSKNPNDVDCYAIGRKP